VVFGSRGPFQPGHFFNTVVSGRGNVVFIDGQIGGAAGTTGYQYFQLLKVNF